MGTPGRAAGAGATRGPRAGYLSDGDSPERPAGPPSPTAFRPYEVGPTARAPPAALWGRLSLHLYGLGGLRPAPGATPRDLCCLLQVDGVARARTGPLRGGPDFLRLDHTFHLELEAARLLRALVLAWDPGVRRHRPCAQGTVLLPTVFRGRIHGCKGGAVGTGFSSPFPPEFPGGGVIWSRRPGHRSLWGQTPQIPLYLQGARPSNWPCVWSPRGCCMPS